MSTKVFVVVLYFIGLNQCQNSTNTINKSEEDCPFIRNPNVALGGQHCCNSTYTRFRRNYGNKNYRLTSLLEKLRAWNCPQFENECENRYFQFNRFTSLVYDRFCNQTTFNKHCRDELDDIDIISISVTGIGKVS